MSHPSDPCGQPLAQRIGADEAPLGPLSRTTSLLVTAGAALATGNAQCVREAVAALREAGVDSETIRGALAVGEQVKARPAALMAEAADVLTGTRLASAGSEGCPAESLRSTAHFTTVMLVAAGAAMAAGCEPCLNQVVPGLIEARVSTDHIRGAVLLGQRERDRAAENVRAAAAAELTACLALPQIPDARELGAARRGGCGCG